MTTAETIRQAGPQYLALQKALSESEWSLTAYPQLTKSLKTAEAAVQTTRDNIRKFDKRSKDQLERFQHLKHHSVKRAWYRTTGKLEEKLQEEEKAWLKEYELVQAAKARCEEQEAEVKEAKKIYEQCETAKGIHEKSQAELNALLQRLFDGPTPSFPSEDVLEQSLTTARQQLDDIHMLAKRQQYITNSLQRAQQCLIGALQQLQSSIQFNTFDFFSHSGYIDWMIHSALAQARDLSTRAQFLVSEVRRIEPNVPHLGDIHIEQDNLVFNVIFDNIFTDLRVRQIIQDALVKIERAALSMQQEVLPEVLRQSKAVDAKVDTSQKEVRRLEKAMWNERSRIMTQVIEGDQGLQGETSQSGERDATFDPPPLISPIEDPQQEESTDEPPPPYTIQERSRR
jgi:hypothetical protein